MSIEEIRKHSYVCMCVGGGRAGGVRQGEMYACGRRVHNGTHLTVVCVSFVPGGLCTSIQDPFPWRLSASHPTLTARTTIEGRLSYRTWRCSTSMILLRTGQILVSDGVREKEIEGVIEREKDLLKVPGYKGFIAWQTLPHMHTYTHRTRHPSPSPGAGG